ncbi:MAG: YebC/PmpR family DNA-binding transcriptional regulator [Victivallales bacterium]|nr:YebC/PmpR family DNA-binding transcriptional regulator [Victivallales bacterium]
MSGHSKWANIKHKKDATDKKKGKIFSNLAKEIMIAAKIGGGDAGANPRLRSALAAAKAQNMPNANIDRAIKKGTGELGDITYEEIVYEAYGPCGVAMIIDCLTDNRNRSASEVRMTLDRNNGNLAGSGAVAWMFKRQAHFVVTGENADEDKLMDIVLDAGAEDIIVEDGVAEIWGAPEAFADMAQALEQAGIAVEEAAVTRRAENVVELKTVDDADKVLRLIDKLEDLDDVQSVNANFEIADEIADQVGE